MSEPRSPLDEALDVLVYAPLGFALAARDELPRLAARGRREFESQAAVARMVGQVAASQGPHQIRQLLDAALDRFATVVLGERPPASSPAPAAPEPATPARTPGPARPRRAAQRGGTGGLPAGELAIPGYDTLSASQVVQRLAGLAPDELEAVRRYEAASRRRQTILNRIAQLQATS